MGPQEAAKAAELLAVRTVIPCHYGTFPILTGTPDALRPLLPSGVELIVPEPGETVS
jgi:L-ascorbate metabolism protein UlaG (beta-lactamase superfamily)